MTKPLREIKVTNSLSHKKEVLETLVPGKLTMYSCGPTVYNLIHIGNLRTALVSDLFFRYFKKVGYDVTFVRNYTDVDDKIIKAASDQKVTMEELTKRFIGEVERDYEAAGMSDPTHKTTVTGHMPEIIAMIEKIIAHGQGYVVDGEVLFSIESFEGYGKLSHKNVEELLAGARVEVDPKKRNPLDFSLWKPAKPGEPSWESPWGKGRPGWHIECSAMAEKWLGPKIDIHHGGTDLIFPHHENEIAQAESATHQAPFARYWLHSAFLNFSQVKMSKSLGNVVTARDALTRYGGELTRFMLLSAHYRSLLEFNDEMIEHSLTGLHRIYEAKLHAQTLLKKRGAGADLRAEAAWGQFAADCEKTSAEIDDNLANDFNTAGALAAAFKLIREFNRTLSEPMASATPSAVLGAEQLIRVLEEDLGDVLGVGRSDAEQALRRIEEVRAARLTAVGVSRPTDDEIRAQIQARLDARNTKNFAEADRIRKDLEARGVVLKDSPQGTTWEFR